jgi:hypothetical protein
VIALIAVEVPQWLSTAPTHTVWQEITSGITDGTVPKQTALEAFAYLYQVDIPDVTVPAGIEGGDEPSDGSGAMSWVRANWSALTADQQAVINRYLVPGPNDQIIPIGASAAPATASAAPATASSAPATASAAPATASSAPATASSAPATASSAPATASSAPASGAAANPQLELDAAHNVAAISVQAPADAPADITAAMTREFEADIAHVGPKLGMPVLTGGNIFFPSIQLILSDTNGGRTLLVTVAIDSKAHYEPCQVTAFKNAWGGETVTPSGGVSPTLHVLMTHEVIHCYQNVVWGSAAVGLSVPPWITEGTALYLAADDTGVAEPIIPSMWQKGYFVPEIALTNRSYDAFGYFSLLAHEGRALWKLMLPAWQAAAAGPARSDPFIAVLGGDAPDIVDNWAESYLRNTTWGDPWIAYGFGLPAATQVYQHPAQAQPAPGWTGSLDGRSNTVLNVDSTTGEVVTVSTSGLASVHDGIGHSALAFTGQRFCTAVSCICPTGTLLAGQDMAPDPLTIPFVAAFNAPEGGSNYKIVAETLADLCRQTSPPPVSTATPGPCGSLCTQSNGDPHLLSVNGVRYDFQAAGEFTLLRSADGSVDIQARQEPFVDTGDVSTNTAIAAKVGSHRVGVYAVSDGLQARVDGAVVDLGSGPMDLGGGASISNYSSGSTHGFEIVFPDGTKMWTLSVAAWGINAQIRPSASLKVNGVGLLGPIVLSGLKVPALPNGTRLPASTDRAQQYQLLYGQFADAWRVTDSTTLFDYVPGKSTASYTIKPYPIEGRALTLADLTPAQLAAGEAACTAITDPGLHDECVFDVGITGDAGFADGYKAIQAFGKGGLVASSAPPASGPPVSGPTAPPAVVSGAVTVTQATSIGGYAIGPNDTVYLSIESGSVETAVQTYSLISFDPTSAKIVHQVSIPVDTGVHYAAGSLWLPGLKTDAHGGNCSVTRFDAATLAEQATIPIPCPYIGGPEIGSDGTAIWYMDPTNYDSTTNEGAVLTRIDPVTNEPGTSVKLPSISGYLIDSVGAVFFADPNDNNHYLLKTGSNALVLLGKFATTTVPGGPGLWVATSDGTSAQYYTAAGSPQATIKIGGGNLVAGDASAAYAEVEVVSADGATRPELLRYPADGSKPTEIAAPPTVNGVAEVYLDNPPPTAPGDGFLKLWTVRGDTAQTSLILLQWAPLH